MSEQTNKLDRSDAYSPALDGLRALAVLLVLAAHVQLPGFSGGFIGVDIFFVLSGFLISRFLLSELHTSGRINYLSFLARRIKRLQPAFIVVSVLTLISAGFFLLPLGEQQGVAKEVISATLFASNFYFSQSADYFAQTSEYRPFLHTWSLAVEEQFYLLWPWLLLAIYTFKKRLLNRAGMIALLFCLFVIGMYCAIQFPGSAYYMLSTRAWELAVGAAMVPIISRHQRWQNWFGLIGLFLVVVAMCLTHPQTRYPGPMTLLPTLATAAMLYSTVAPNPPNAISLFFSLAFLRQIGLASYAIYLCHWPLLAVARVAFPSSNGLMRDIVLGLISIALGWLIYRWIELPIRQSSYSRYRIFGVAGIAMLGVIVASAALGYYAKNYGIYAPRYADLAAAERDRETSECIRVDFPCVHTGSALAIWGDSHAHGMQTAIIADAATHGQSVSIFATNACAPIIGYGFEWKPGAVAGVCQDSNNRALQKIIELKKSGLKEVILIARWNPHFAIASPLASERQIQFTMSSYAGRVADHQAKFSAGLGRAIASLQAAGLKVTIIAPSPEFTFGPIDCVSGRRIECWQSKHDVLERHLPVLAMLKSFPDVRVLDPIPFLCPNDRCPLRDESGYWYFDNNHLTKSTARALWWAMRK